METLLMSNLLMRAALALIMVLGLLGGIHWMIRRWGLRVGGHPGDRVHRLEILETLSLDHKRKIVLLRFDEQEHLLCLGENQDMVLGSKDVAGQADTAAILRSFYAGKEQDKNKVVNQ